jgi:hypothetical protein
MALAITSLGITTTTTDASSVASPSVSPAADSWLIVAVTNSKATTPDTASLSDNGPGLTYTQIGTANSGNLIRASLFKAKITGSPGSFVVTATFAADQTGLGIEVIQVTGADASEIVGGSNNFAIASATAQTSVTVTLAAFADATNNGAIAVCSRDDNRRVAPEAGWTQLSDQGFGTPNFNHFTMHRTGQDTTAVMTDDTPGESGRWAAVAFEVKAATAGQTAEIGQTAETDTAQTMGRAKSASTGLISETNAAQPVGRSKTLGIGQATETDIAQPTGKAKARALTLVTETDTVETVGVTKARAIGQAAEANVANAVGRLKTRLLGQATETNVAMALVLAVTNVIGRVVGIDRSRGTVAALDRPRGTVEASDGPQGTVTATDREVA